MQHTVSISVYRLRNCFPSKLKKAHWAKLGFFRISAPNDTEKQYFDIHTNHLSVNPSSDSKNNSSSIQVQQKQKSSPINIHIEVDIDPPKAVTAEDQLSPDELENLGLPATHVHFSSGGNKPPSEELLAPSDIKVSTYRVLSE